METITVRFRDWVFEVDKAATEDTYKRVVQSGTERCLCNDCKNYLSYRDKVFPTEILQFFADLGVDYKKEVEITTWEELPNGLRHIGGWFHFKGQILSGKKSNVPLPKDGYTLSLTHLTDNFAIGFDKGAELTYFKKEEEDLVQIEFETTIPSVIGPSLEVVSNSKQ